MSLLQIVYASAAGRPFSTAELLDLLARSRTANRIASVTGFLGLHRDTFLQLIEGPPVAVRALFERIRSDPRHVDVTLLTDRTVETRWFPDWSMGFDRMDEVIPGPGLSQSLQFPFTPRQWATRLDDALAFLDAARTIPQSDSTVPS